MRRPMIVLAAVALVVVGVVAVVATRPETCDDVFSTTDTRLRPVDASLATEHLVPATDGVGDPRWVLSTGEPDTRTALVDVGRWTAYVDRTEVSRIDDDGSVRWTRSTPRSRAVRLDASHLGLLAFVDGRFHLAVVDGQGRLARCDDLFDSSANVATDQTGGYLAAGVTSPEPDAAPLVRRIDGDGTERWRVEQAGLAARTLPEVFVGSGVALVGQTDEELGVVLTAFDDASGSVLWELEDDGELSEVRWILGVEHELVFAIVTDGSGERSYLAALDLATGEVRWELETAARSMVDGRVRRVGDLAVIEAPTMAIAIDPTDGHMRWLSSTDTPVLGRPVADRAVVTDGDLLVASGLDGAIIDLLSGASAPLFETEALATLDSVSVVDDVLLTDVVVYEDIGDDPLVFLSAWSFEPDAATLVPAEEP